MFGFCFFHFLIFNFWFLYCSIVRWYRDNIIPFLHKIIGICNCFLEFIICFIPQHEFSWCPWEVQTGIYNVVDAAAWFSWCPQEFTLEFILRLMPLQEILGVCKSFLLVIEFILRFVPLFCENNQGLISSLVMHHPGPTPSMGIKCWYLLCRFYH